MRKVVVEEIEVLRQEWLAHKLSRDDMKREIRRLLFKYHPDRNDGNRLVAEERTRMILDWYHAVNSDRMSAFVSRPIDPRPPQPTPPATNTTSQQCVVFMIGGEYFACDVRWVVGVRNLRDVKTSSDSLPKWIHDRLGVFTLDGSRRTSNSGAPTETAQILLLRIDRSSKAFVVDRVDGVVSPTPGGMSSHEGVQTFIHAGWPVTLVFRSFFGL